MRKNVEEIFINKFLKFHRTRVTHELIPKNQLISSLIEIRFMRISQYVNTKVWYIERCYCLHTDLVALWCNQISSDFSLSPILRLHPFETEFVNTFTIFSFILRTDSMLPLFDIHTQSYIKHSNTRKQCILNIDRLMHDVWLSTSNQCVLKYNNTYYAFIWMNKDNNNSTK